MALTRRLIRACARIRRTTGREEGAVVIVVAGMLVVFVALLAFAINLGILRAAREKAQVAADAGALAGAHDISLGTPTTANADATAMAARNDPSATATATSPYNGNSSSIQVSVSGSVPLPFGLSTGRVSATAVANSQPVNQFSDSDFSYPTQNNGSGNFFEEFCAALSINAFCTVPNPNMGPWTVVTGSVDLNGGYLTPPTKAQDPNITAAAQIVDMVGSYSNGEIQQSITTIPGKRYQVSFWLSGNTNGPPTNKPLQLLVGGSVVGTWTYTGPYGVDNSPAPATWTEETASFTATGTSTTIAFLSTVNDVIAGANNTTTVNYADFRYGAAITDLEILTNNEVLTQ